MTGSSDRRDAEIKAARLSVWIGTTFSVAGVACYPVAVLLARGYLALLAGGPLACLGLFLILAGKLRAEELAETRAQGEPAEYLAFIHDEDWDEGIAP